ncbi:hypothetical protein BGW38_003498 [Lunasporangiospora selenospora]|uniref:Photolyase/cryptochrome alpha/beta domain-containing protein n=1 Tax=Lunasporangiospora selenospora TaxID=979761 RepID=A0A9P6KCT3_9FUNG|nr:hypothetical protein BGW38_003498 [Lunasporangiospora selenospora]
MPPKRRPAGEEDDDPRKRHQSAAATSNGNGHAPARTAATSKPGAVRGTPKPGVRKGNATTLANRAKLGAAAGSAVKKEAPPPVITKNTLMWFRSDLRIHDNRALYAASARAKIGESKSLICLYIISEQEWAHHDDAPVKIDFWFRNLAKLKKALDKLNIPLVVKNAGTKDDVAGLLESAVKEYDVSHVFWNAEYMVDEKRRDVAVKKALTKIPGVYVEEHEDQCIIPPKEMKTKVGNNFTSFIQFFAAWCHIVETNAYLLQASPMPEANAAEARQIYAKLFEATVRSSHTHSLDRKEIENLYPAGEEAAQTRLLSFIHDEINQYHVGRENLEDQGWMSVIPYLSNGIISARQCVSLARESNNNKIIVGSKGVRAWIKEFAWREFYKGMLVSFPKLSMSRPYLPFTDNIRWSNDDRKFQMWCQGKTGYPIVDAGMRQLNTTGFMNNHVRMTVACFLVKDLLINWQKGEKYFMNNLVDGDLATNNGGWQWCASTGADAQPYYRVFNPVAQSKKLDPVGEYIRHWVPELKTLPDSQIHDPYHSLSAKDFGKLGYPKPIVDHAEAKKKYTEEYKRVVPQS